MRGLWGGKVQRIVEGDAVVTGDSSGSKEAYLGAWGNVLAVDEVPRWSRLEIDRGI